MTSIDVTTDAGVATVVISQPERKNACTQQMFEGVAETFQRLGDDGSVRAIVLTGEGGDFCSGADVAAPPGQASATGTPDSGLARLRKISRAPTAIIDAPQPVVARIDGVAVGAGLSLALACDYLVASDRARFSAIFAQRGLSLDCGMSWLLPRAVGLPRAKELVMLAEVIDASRALDIGLVSSVVPVEELDRATADVVARLAAGPPLALSMSKRLLHAGFDSSLAAALEAEGVAQNVNFGTSDVVEAGVAFKEKRPASFSGR